MSTLTTKLKALQKKSQEKDRWPRVDTVERPSKKAVTRLSVFTALRDASRLR